MKTIHLSLLSVFASIPLFASDAEYHVENPDESHPVRSHQWVTSNDKSFIRIAENIYDSTHLVDVPILDSNKYVLAKLCLDLPGNKSEERPCMLSPDKKHCILYEQGEDGKVVTLKLTFDAGVVKRIEKMEGDTLTEISNTLLEGQKAPTEMVSIGAAQVLGQPRKLCFVEESGVLKIRVKSLIQEVEEMRTTLSGQVSDVRSSTETLQSTLDQLKIDLDTSLSDRLTYILAESHREDSEQMSSLLEATKAYLATNTAHHRKQSEEHTDAALAETLFGEDTGLFARVTHELDTSAAAIRDHTEAQLGTATTSINGQIREFRQALAQLVNESAGQTGKAISESRQNLAQLLNDCTNQTNDAISGHTAEMRNTLQSILGIRLRADGRPKDGSAMAQITDAITHAYRFLGVTGDMQQAFNAVTQVLKIHGGLPILYWNSIETMLFGHTIYGRAPVVKPLTEYLVEIEALMSGSDFFKQLVAPWNKHFAGNIITISEFFKNSSDTTIMRVLPEIIRLFGTTFPSYEAPSLNMARYCADAHFSTEDFGLYAWIKDIHSVFATFSESRGPDLATRARDAKAVFDRLIQGVVIEGEEERKAIPLTHFYGLQTYKDILKECVQVIERANQNSFEGRFESRAAEILRKVSASARKMDAAVQQMRETCENIVRYSLGIPGGVRGLEELINQCVHAQLRRHGPPSA
ncbi:MAG: hypothetical protein LBF66_01150 [Holosporales bacterium]|jgi:hypothetical protein|nr:hypothetical protein [Holosporales bacterium]